MEPVFVCGTITVMVIVLLAALGVILGSFVNALVWRLHEIDTLGNAKSKKAAKQRKDLSVLKGRSMCPQCRHELAAKDLVPVLSWIWLRGRCRYCQAHISWQYPAVEVLTGALFALSYQAWPYGLHGIGLFQFVCWLVFVTGFMALAVYDLRWYLLPDKIVLPLTILAGAVVTVTALWLQSVTAVWQPLVGGLIIFGLFWGLYQASKGGWIGGGDVKVALALGLLAGTPLKAFLVIFLASLFGTLVSIPVLLQGKRGLKMHIPFGPYLLLATVVVVLYGNDIVTWYENLFLG